jgi:hypothetical protein
MNHEQAIKTVIDLLGAQAVADHITGARTSEQVRIATVLAIDNAGQLSSADIATIEALPPEP